MIIAMAGAIGSMITAIATNHSFIWQAIAAMWIGASMFSEHTIQKLTKKEEDQRKAMKTPPTWEEAFNEKVID